MKTFRILVALLILGALASCEREPMARNARVTNYPIFTVEGDDVLFYAEGATINLPPVTAEEGGQDISDKIEISATGTYRGGTTLDANKADKYELAYSAVNVDGFAGNAYRTVYVVKTGDLVNSIEGLYTSTVVRNGSTSAQYTDMEYVLIWKNADGTYGMSCAIGGYYELGRGYGPGYRSQAVITANDISTNDFTVPTFGNVGFGGATEITSFTVDAANKKINFTAEWSFGYTFECELTQVEI